jgi:nucleoside-diphosphate-sugar epimerase
MVLESESPDFSFRYPRVVVVGGAGFIGSHLVDSLLAEGCNVRSIDDFSSGKVVNLDHAKSYGDKFETYDYDISNGGSSLNALLEGFDLVLNQAASKMNVCLKDPQRDLLVNAGGTLNLLTAAKEVGCKRFVHASTGSVYGSAQIFPTDESHSLNPVSFYGVSKLAGEKYVRMFNDEKSFQTSILRYFHVYGPRQESNDLGGVVAIFIRNILNNEPIRIFGDGKQVRSFTYVSDLISINKKVALAENVGGLAFNCASGIQVSIEDLAKKVCMLMASPNHPIVYEPARAGDIWKFQVSNILLKELGITWNVEFERGLEETIRYFSERVDL